MFKKRLLFCFVFLLISGCITIPLKQLKVDSIDENWSVGAFSHYHPGRGYMIILRNKNISYMGIRIVSFKAPNVKLIERDNNEKNCKNDFTLEFNAAASYGSPAELKEKIRRELEKNEITFDPAKSFIIKEGKKYNLRGQDKNNEIKNISEQLLVEINTLTVGQRSMSEIIDGGTINKIAIFGFSSPFGCKALENTILEIGGIYLNGKELEPIRIKLNYTNKRSELN